MNKKNKWFTLIELLIVITIIVILFIASNRVNLNPQIDNQKSREFTNQVQTTIESIRNASLLWKWMWADLIQPSEWFISLSNLPTGTNTWSLNVKYLSGWNLENFSSLLFPIHTEIKELSCYEIWKTNSETKNEIDLRILWSTLSLSWCTNSWAILDITTWYKNNPNFDRVIEINTVSWLIQRLD